MRTPDEETWGRLRVDFPHECIEWIREKLKRPGLVEITAQELAGNCSCNLSQAKELLDRVVSLDAMAVEARYQCGCCGAQLTDDEAVQAVCAYCDQAYTDCGDGVAVTTAYVREAEAGRSVPWVLVVHGMNTRGSWQEDLSWLVATTYGRSVPVFIYKYGIVRPGVLFRRRQRALARKLFVRLQHLAGKHGNRLGARPDIIAHSFGTWLVGHALQNNRDLRVGRVILTGSILRPDFGWKGLTTADQVEAVLNHYGKRDIWTRVAEFVIPDSGPSGRRGFAPCSGALNRAESDFTHSKFFEAALMDEIYKGVWRPFLTRPASELGVLADQDEGRSWRPAPWLVRATLPRLVILLIGVVVMAFFLVALLLGVVQLISWFIP